LTTDVIVAHHRVEYQFALPEKQSLAERLRRIKVILDVKKAPVDPSSSQNIVHDLALLPKDARSDSPALPFNAGFPSDY